MNPIFEFTPTDDTFNCQGGQIPALVELQDTTIPVRRPRSKQSAEERSALKEFLHDSRIDVVHGICELATASQILQ